MRVQLSTQSFDVQQRLLQQDQLWLDRHIESSGHLEKPYHQSAERYLADRLSKDRLTDGTDCRFELFCGGVRRHPAGPDVCLCNRPVITVEKCQKVLGKITLVRLVQGAHDAKINGPVLSVRTNEYVSRVHVRMKETVAKSLGEKDLDSIVCQLFHIDTSIADGIDIADRNAADPFHHHDIAPCMLPIDLRDIDDVRVGEIVSQLSRIGSFAHQVHLVINGLVVFVDDLNRTQAPAF